MLTCWFGGRAAAQAEGTFPGTLACDAGGSSGPLRQPVSVTVENGRARYRFDLPGGAFETGDGALGPDRRLVLTGQSTGRARYTSRYSGQLGGRGGTLTGIHVRDGTTLRRCQISLGDG